MSSKTPTLNLSLYLKSPLSNINLFMQLQIFLLEGT